MDPDNMATDASLLSQLHRLANELLEPILKGIIQSDMYVVPTKPYKNSKLQDAHKFPFVSKQCTAFGKSTGRVGSVYQKLLGDHIYYYAPEVYINIKDLNFTSARAFFNSLANSPDPRFTEFLINGQGRGISMFHIATRSFPDTFDRLLSFDKFAKRLEGKQNATGHLDTYHEVVECLDHTMDSKKGILIERLVCQMQGTEMLGREFDLAFAALKRYHLGKMNEIFTLRQADLLRRYGRRLQVASHRAQQDRWDAVLRAQQDAGHMNENNGDQDVDSDGDIRMEDDGVTANF